MKTVQVELSAAIIFSGNVQMSMYEMDDVNMSDFRSTRCEADDDDDVVARMYVDD